MPIRHHLWITIGFVIETVGCIIKTKANHISDEVKIKTKHLERIARNMGLYEKTGRDMLEN